MFTEDYLMRILNQALAALMTAAGLKKRGRFEEALQVINQALEQLTTLPASLLDQMEEDSLLSLLKMRGNLEANQLALLADLWQEQGKILARLNMKAQALAAQARALRFGVEAALAETGGATKKQIARVRTLSRRLDVNSLAEGTRLALVDFYQALLARDEQDLIAAGTCLQEARDALNAISTGTGLFQI